MGERLPELTELELPPGSLAQLEAAERQWRFWRQDSPATAVVQRSDEACQPEWDVIIAGATLGVFVGAALARQGFRVLLLERGELRGREQEWNIARQELQSLRSLELLTPDQLEACIVSEFNPVRVHFDAGPDWWVRDVLNLGVDPVRLLAALKQTFLTAGGHLQEQCPFETVSLHRDGVTVRAGGQSWRGRLLLDAMGHGSPIARQARNGRKPDALCLVVGSCSQGAGDGDRTSADLMASFTPIEQGCQYFWEAFPAREGRTTYLFTYLDPGADAPSPRQLLSDYLRLLPQYQGWDLSQRQFQRLLCGVLPSWRRSPLRTPWARVLCIGDSSGLQSPLSFGGFGSLLRHLPRLVTGLTEALGRDYLDKPDLDALLPYQPNLAVTWMFQRSMSLRPGESVADPQRINRLLVAVFGIMTGLGDRTLKPFLQDVIRWPGLALTLLLAGLRHPLLVLRLLPVLGIPALVSWSGHFAMLGLYTLLNGLAPLLRPLLAILPPRARYRWSRRLEGWRYGSGADHSPSRP